MIEFKLRVCSRYRFEKQRGTVDACCHGSVESCRDSWEGLDHGGE